MPGVAAAGAECRQEALPAVLGFVLWPAPQEQCDREEDHGDRVEGEDDRDAAQVGDDQPGQGRPDRTGQVDVDQIQPGCRPQLCPGHQLGDGRPPAGLLHGYAGAQRESEGEQQGWRHLPDGGEHGDQDADDEEVGLDGEQQPAPIEGVGQDAPR